MVVTSPQSDTDRDSDRLRLMSLVVHELATPLTTVKGYLQLLNEGLAGEMPRQQADIVASALYNTVRMERMVRDLSDFAKLEGNRLDIRPAAFQIHTVAFEVMSMLFDRIEEKDLDLQMAVSSALPAVYADRARIVQVMTNLLSNAIKYTPAHGNLRVSAVHTDNAVQVSVQDDGVGIAADEQPQIFTPFFRAKDPEIRAQAGTGLGLTITRMLLRAQGGDIWFESTPGAGSTFHFTLPVAHARGATPARSADPPAG